MPLLDYGRPDNWELYTDLNRGELFMFRKFVFDAKKSFKYKKDKDFIATLEPNTDYSKPYLYTYDSTRGDKDLEYSDKLQNLVEEANKILFKEFKNNKDMKGYRIDIMGNWSNGSIVILQSKNKQDNVIHNAHQKYVLDKLDKAKLISKSWFSKKL